MESIKKERKKEKKNLMSDKHIQTHLKNFEFSTLCKKVKINYNNLVFFTFLGGAQP